MYVMPVNTHKLKVCNKSFIYSPSIPSFWQLNKLYRQQTHLLPLGIRSVSLVVKGSSAPSCHGKVLTHQRGINSENPSRVTVQSLAFLFRQKSHLWAFNQTNPKSLSKRLRLRLQSLNSLTKKLLLSYRLGSISSLIPPANSAYNKQFLSQSLVTKSVLNREAALALASISIVAKSFNPSIRSSTSNSASRDRW